MITLEVLNSAFKGKRFTFKDGITLGSGPSCTIRAQHKDLCDVHVRFFTSEKQKPMIEICDEKAHLFVNGKDVIRSELRHNDDVTIGPLRFKVTDMARVSSAAMRLEELMEDFQQKFGDEVYDFAREDLFYLSTKDPTLRESVSFSIPSKDRFIEQAQVFLGRLAKQSGMDEQQVDSFMTCAKELILNAHRHGHKYDETRKILIRYRDGGGKLGLTIEDEGEGFDHQKVIAEVKSKDAAKAARDRYQAGGFGGLGFQLVTKLATDLRYNDKGNKVTFSIAKNPVQS